MCTGNTEYKDTKLTMDMFTSYQLLLSLNDINVSFCPLSKRAIYAEKRAIWAKPHVSQGPF